MPFCKKCGLGLDNDAEFCSECGTPVVKSSRSQKKESSESVTGSQTQIRSQKSLYGVVSFEALPEDHLIADRYVVKEKVGQGGFGAVYRVFDKNMNIDKALKVIPEAITGDKEAMFDLQNEAQTMIALNHPNIVRVYDFHKTGTIKFIDMEFLDGKTLSEMKLEYSEKKIPEARVKEYALKIAEGMAYAHENGVLHKDLKPHNIKITSKGIIKIMDFGIAETVRTSMSRLEHSSSSGTLVYMSPEQLRGKEVGKEADIYSFGATLYELLSGHPPFYRGDIQYQIINEKPETLTNISSELNNFMLKCLQKEYQNRYRNFNEVISALGGKVSPVIVRTEQRSVQEEKVVSSPTEVLSIAKNMILVKGGSFNMGTNEKYHTATPVHEVKVSSFYIGRYEVTQKEYQAVMGTNPSNLKGDNLPVESVSWYDAVEYCNKLSIKEGLTPVYSIGGNTNPSNWSSGTVTANWSANGYRLPTEAEWEYAARGGNKSKGYTYSGSNSIGEIAWHRGNSGRKTHPVGQKRANELGIYDMSGNVWEWCWDWYGSYTGGSKTNPKGASSGSSRVYRGGSWLYSADLCTVSFRLHCFPSVRYSYLGFRLSRVIP